MLDQFVVSILSIVSISKHKDQYYPQKNIKKYFSIWQLFGLECTLLSELPHIYMNALQHMFFTANLWSAAKSQAQTFLARGTHILLYKKMQSFFTKSLMGSVIESGTFISKTNQTGPVTKSGPILFIIV